MYCKTPTPFPRLDLTRHFRTRKPKRYTGEHQEEIITKMDEAVVRSPVEEKEIERRECYFQINSYLIQLIVP